MRSPMSSNLVIAIEKAIDNCFYNGEGKAEDGRGLVVYAEWIDSKNIGYAVMHITIFENGIVRFSYDDYGTECKP